MNAFIKRLDNGLSLSDKVWKYTERFKNEIELGIDCGLRDGLSAPEIARNLKMYLQYPDKLFRRVRTQHGILKLSKTAAAFHPGQGVYRSSYKNARRLAATETNIAYRTADFERWQDFDFVVGIEIKLSNNHTLNGEPFTDICDKLKCKTGHRISEFSMFPEQRELLFDKGMHLKFESVRKIRSGRIIFRMTEI